MDLKPILISIIRTVVMPLVAGGLLQLAILAGAAEPSLELRSALASVIAITWYLFARFLETKNRYWGLLLGVAVEPNYEDDGTEDQMISAVSRTVVPLVVGWALTTLARWGFELPQDTVIVAVQAAITSGYYGLIRIIEGKRPKAGKLIGGVAQPIY